MPFISAEAHKCASLTAAWTAHVRLLTVVHTRLMGVARQLTCLVPLIPHRFTYESPRPELSVDVVVRTQPWSHRLVCLAARCQSTSRVAHSGLTSSFDFGQQVVSIASDSSPTPKVLLMKRDHEPFMARHCISASVACERRTLESEVLLT